MAKPPEARAVGLARYGFLHDPAGRALRGRRIVALLRTFFAEDLSSLRVLDIGCSAGLITREIAPHAAWTVGVDVDRAAVAYASVHHAVNGRLSFAVASGDALPFADAAFDLVVCNHVYGHLLVRSRGLLLPSCGSCESGDQRPQICLIILLS